MIILHCQTNRGIKLTTRFFYFDVGSLMFVFSKILALGFDEKFIRTWEYYFDYCAAGFKSRTLGVYQVCFLPKYYYDT
ncbi:hypothetical protein CMV_015864 [Castanea mollissima]|uniref:Uncharacterized protein n=1 Tax=Castanea mollissima TaxID=60419 RepID=A0A8J4VST2_9ROSI|nr:hypothetical protein CMV_015864 [Castanea mollissima]